MDRKTLTLSFAFLLILISFASSASAIASFSYTGSSARYVSTQSYPSLNGLYSSSDLNTYWPVVGDNSVCRGRQDILLQVMPAGCQPTVVRSDLIAEQSVPVLCQLTAYQVNPLLDIKAIDSITFSGRYPSAVSTVGYYPAQAALMTGNSISNNAMLNNAGYVVVVLKRQQNETALPESVTLNLTARVRYDSYNALGVGSAYFILDEQTDSEFRNASNKNSFWQGRYFIKADSFDAERATLSLYYGDRKITTTTVQRGQQSGEIYIPGFSTCQASLRVAYDGFESSGSDRARIEVQEGNKKTDVFDAYDGMYFANNKCRVSGKISSNADGTGSLSVVCSGDRATLSILPGSATGIADESKIEDKNVKAYLANARAAIEEYQAVAQNYPSESGSNSKSYGESALQTALELIKNSPYKAYLSSEYSSLVKAYEERYPSSLELAQYKLLEPTIATKNSENSAAVFQIDNKYITVRVTGFMPSQQKSSKVKLNIAGKDFEYETGKDTANIKGTSIYFETKDSEGKSRTQSISIVKIQPDEVKLTSTCTGYAGSPSADLSEGETATMCGVSVMVKEIDAEKLAKVRVVPKVDNTQTETNLSVSIGIEKRAVQLSTEKASELVKNLNDSINKFQSISDKMSRTAKGLKAACFATAAYLTFDNFLSGLDGSSTARKNVMRGENGWTVKCTEAFKNSQYIQANNMEGSEYVSVDDCLRQNADKINADVAAATEAAKTQDAHVKASTQKTQTSTMGTEIKMDESVQNYANTLSSAYKTDSNIGEIVKDPNMLAKSTTYEQMKALEYNALLLSSPSISKVQRDSAQLAIDKIKKGIVDEQKRIEDQEAAKNSLGTEYAKLSDANVYRDENSIIGSYNGMKYNVNSPKISGVDDKYVGYPIEKINYAGQTYLVILTQEKSLSSQRTIVTAYTYDSQTRTATPAKNLDALKAKFPVFVQREAGDYINTYSNPTVKYYDSGSAKGMPAVVPVDVKEGWYAGVQQVLSTGLGSTSSYQSSGQVSSFWLCNVGKNTREEFSKSGFGDDLCTQINLYTGQSIEIGGIEASKARSLVSRAQQAITQASQQYSSGVKQVRIEGSSFSVVNQAVIPSVRCQDYMSPEKCLLLFNVCDPVICPTSRCNLNGQYYVSDVAASGIVGSALLCLPNAKEGIALPVCLTGLSSGLDSYISVLKSHRDCLQEQLDTGSTVGICDQIYSIYMCEFFWREITPIAKELLPKAVAGMYGQSADGGGEYINVAGAWQNTQEAANYFTQTYAVNSMKAFQIRSVEEAGGEFCKAFASIAAPKTFDSLIEPDSPPQFTGWFSSIKYTDATVPATSQYKVYYHIYAGKDTSVQYQVYLKNPATVSVISVPQTLVIASGFITRGEYGTETRDFTAPEGYKEMCVNINGDEECGFGQVTSSFAINYLTDQARASTINQTGITTASGCVSGEIGTSASFNLNLQATAESALNPAIYNQGIIRICSTSNPGSTSSPDRYVQVGYCDNSNVGCWLDTESTARAISEGNNGTKTELQDSLKNLQEQQRAQLQAGGSIIYQTEKFNSEYDSLAEKVSKLQGSTLDLIQTNLNSVVLAIKNVNDKVIMSSQKAQLGALSGDAYSKAASNVLALIGSKGVTASQETGTAQQASSGTSSSATTISLNDGLSQVNSLSGSYSSNKAFVDGLYNAKVISSAEYDDIRGNGIFDAEEDMIYVQKLLMQKKSFELRNRKGESGLLTSKAAPALASAKGYYSSATVQAYQVHIAEIPIPVYISSSSGQLEVYIPYKRFGSYSPFAVGKVSSSAGEFTLDIDSAASSSEYLGIETYGMLNGQKVALSAQQPSASSSRAQQTSAQDAYNIAGKDIEIEVANGRALKSNLNYRFNGGEWSVDGVFSTYKLVSDSRFDHTSSLGKYLGDKGENEMQIIQSLRGKGFYDGVVILANALQKYDSDSALITNNVEIPYSNVLNANDMSTIVMQVLNANNREISASAAQSIVQSGTSQAATPATPQKTYKFTGNIGFLVNGDVKGTNDLHVGDDISVQVPHDCDTVNVKLQKGSELVKEEMLSSAQSTSNLGTLDAGDYTLSMQCYQGNELRQSSSMIFSVRTTAQQSF